MSFTAKSVILDIADNWGEEDYMGLRSVDFWSGGSKISLADTDFTAYETSVYNSNYSAKKVFDTSLIKTGDAVDGGVYNSWMSTGCGGVNQRLIVVFDSAQVFDEIRINNFHASGTWTHQGSKNVVIQISTAVITDTTYGALIEIPGEESGTIFSGQFDEHIDQDVEDEQTLTLSGVTYDGNGNTSGTAPTDTTSYISGDTVTVLGNTGSLAKTGYVFVGWNTASDGTGTGFVADDTFLMGAANVTLYADWQILLHQFAFRFRQDDGAEAAATWKAAENTNILLAPGTKARIRIGIDVSGDPVSNDFQLEFRRKPFGSNFDDWRKVT